MRRLATAIATLAVLASLALPAGAQAHKPALSVARAKAAIHAADEHVVIDSCSRWTRTTIHCAYSELAFYAGIEVEDPTAELHSWATAIQGRHRVAVSWELTR